MNAATPGQAADAMPDSAVLRAAILTTEGSASGAAPDWTDRGRLDGIIASWIGRELPPGTPSSVAASAAQRVTAGLAPFVEAEALRLAQTAIAAQEPHAADGALERALRALKALDELFKIDSDLRNPWNARALTIVLRGLGRGGTADEEINAALGPDPQPAPGIPLRSDAETADMLRADLADAEAQLARWPKCPAGCNCRTGIEDDADRNECGCDGPCNGGEQPAPGLANAIAEARRYRDALQEVRAIILEGGNSTEGSRLRRSRAVIRKSLEGK